MVSRPAALGTLVVVGMIVAALSFVVSLVSAGYGAAVYMNSTAARDRLLRNAPPDLPLSNPSQPVLWTVPAVTPVGRHGMDPNQRSATLDAVGQRIEMSPQQAQQLDALLAEDGDEIFGIQRGQDVLPPAIFAQIGDRLGRLPAADGSEPFHFETPAGRAEVYDNRALFYRQNALTPVRALAGRRSNSTAHPVLLPADVDALVHLMEEACTRGGLGGKPLNEAQLQTLRSMLADPQQKLVSLIAVPEGNVLGINGASVRSDGYAMIDFSGGVLMLGPAGNVILRSDRASIPVVSSGACLLVIVEGLVSVGMAVFLLIICLGLKGEPRRRLRPLVGWSIGKIALSIVGAVAVGWMTGSFLTHSIAPRTNPATPMALTIAALVAVAGCAYPVAVLLVARSQGVREYYDPAH